jgi:phosphohistidine swiveling domain-containing protein
MELSDFFDDVNSAYRGTDDNAPAAGTPDYTDWLLTTNRKIRKYARDKKVSRASLWKATAPNELGTVATAATTALTGTNTRFTDYRVGDKILVSGETIRTIATIPSDTSLTVTAAFSNTASAKTFTHTSIIATGVQAYSLSRRFLNPSDKIIILTTAGHEDEYTVVKPQDRDTVFRAVYISGHDPQTITFEDDITSTSAIVGGTLEIPGFYMPDPMVNATDLIPVDDPDWLVYSVAGELAFNDLTYESKSADLILQANLLYKEMTRNNRRGTAGNPSKSRTNVVRIPGSNR